MRADYKEIRLSTFNDALKRMEAIKETSDISSKVSQVQNIISLSKGDSVPQIQEINAMMITIVKAMEDLFINTYGVLENSYEEYLASDSSLAKLWEQMQTQDEGTRKVLDLNDQSGVADYNRGNDILKNFNNNTNYNFYDFTLSGNGKRRKIRNGSNKELYTKCI